MVSKTDPCETHTNSDTDVNSKNEKNWRSQAQRSKEVRDISKILASLEPGSTPAKKIMLAVRFEEQIFKSCNNHDEYQKKLMKRLKKLQKTYKPPSLPSIDHTINTNASVNGQSKDFVKKKEDSEMERELRRKYGNKLLFIIENAAEAFIEMKKRQGEKGASLLKKHVDNVAQWAIEIGTVPESYLFYGGERRKKCSNRVPDYMHKLEKYLEQTVNTIRHHVMKLTNPDLYLDEEFIRIEKTYNKETSMEISKAIDSNIVEVSEPQRNTLMAKALKLVPPLRKQNDQDLQNARLSCLSKMSSATDVIVSIISAKDNFDAKSGILKKMHEVAKDSFDFLEKNYDKTEQRDCHIVLEDAWNKYMEYSDMKTSSQSDDNLLNNGSESKSKRQKRSKNNVILKSRVLCKAGRKISTQLLCELKSKHAHFLRPTEVGVGARVRMTFGKAFDMIIFLSPLFVIIRPLSMADGSKRKSSLNKHKSTDGFTSIETPDATLSSFSLSVLGTKGPYHTIGSFVAKKLEYASSRATHILRQCFADLAGPYYEIQHSSDFEIEVAEISALLKFLQIAKETYDVQTPSETDEISLE